MFSPRCWAPEIARDIAKAPSDFCFMDFLPKFIPPLPSVSQVAYIPSFNESPSIRTFMDVQEFRTFVLLNRHSCPPFF